jgi:hypothetical protein
MQLQLLFIGFCGCVNAAELLILLSHGLVEIRILRFLPNRCLILLNRFLRLSSLGKGLRQRPVQQSGIGIKRIQLLVRRLCKQTMA